jgi:hypothetical protein
MIPEDKLRAKLRELIQREINEMTTTGNVAGYNIPAAFAGSKNKARRRAVATQLGMILTKRGEEELTRSGDKLLESKMPYHKYKNSGNMTPHQKIAKAISEVNKNLQEVDRTLKMNARLQTESGIASEALWKRTQGGLLKLEGRLLELAARVRNIRGK